MRHALLAAALAPLLLTSCDKPAEKSTSDTPSAPATPIPTSPTAPTANAASSATPAPTTLPPPTAVTPAKSLTPAPLTAPATPSPLTPARATDATSTTAAPTVPAPQASANLTAADLQPQLDQAMQYLKDHKYDLAEKALNTLDQQKSSWPTAVQTAINPKLDSLRKALTAAQGGSSALDALKGFTSSPSNTPNNVK